MKKKYTLVLVVLLAMMVSICDSQVLIKSDSDIPHLFDSRRQINVIETPQKVKTLISQSMTESDNMTYDTSRWKNLVDEIWGEGPSTEKKLKMFDHYWDSLNTGYASFVNLEPINWDSLIAELRSEISQGVSKGRFMGIMSYLIYKINDAHTNFFDWELRNQDLYHGLPMVANYVKNSFPATLTALDDTTALVINAYPNNVFNLENGDIILGYNDKTLSYLINEILYHKLPIIMTFGSTNAATIHNLTVAVACSWNLYDTINIKKADGRLINLPVKLIKGRQYWNEGYEIMPIKGITLPRLYEVYQGDPIASGVINDNGIGYIAFFSCLDRSGDSLYQHVKYLVEEKKVKGLIIDVRNNIGGVFNAFDKALKYLGNQDLINWFNCADRGNPNDRSSMTTVPYYAQYYNIYDDDPNYFEGKIAILTGPNAMSAGDVLPVTFKQLPNVKLFGKSTAGAFGACVSVTNNMDDGYGAIMQAGNFILLKEPDKYLSHLEYPVDERVWFTSENVRNGKDDVLEAAKDWINETSNVDNIVDYTNDIFVYPNPANKFIRINDELIKNDEVVKIFSSLGNIVKECRYGSGIDISSLNSGIYYIMLNSKVMKFTKI